MSAVNALDILLSVSLSVAPKSSVQSLAAKNVPIVLFIDVVAQTAKYNIVCTFKSNGTHKSN